LKDPPEFNEIGIFCKKNIPSGNPDLQGQQLQKGVSTLEEK
jgi:hypothetical protein